MRAMILAAGLGTRMRPLTDHCPKPLLEAGGKPLIVHHIERLVAAGVRELVINTAYRGAQIESALGNGHRWFARIEYSREGEALETGGGIRRALPLLGDQPFVLINGDIWSDFPLLSLPVLGDDQAHLVLVNNPEHHPKGDFVLDTEGRVGSSPGPRLTFSGISLLQPGLFANQPDGAFPLAPLLREAIAAGRVSGQHHRGRWIDVGTPARLAQLDQLLRSPLEASSQVDIEARGTHASAASKESS